jgi:hypothetical protein
MRVAAGDRGSMTTPSRSTARPAISATAAGVVGAVEVLEQDDGHAVAVLASSGDRGVQAVG